MANELRISGNRAYIEKEFADIAVSAVRAYIELISNEIRVSASQVYIEKSQPQLSVSAVGVYVENRKNENNFVLYINGSSVSPKSFSYFVTISVADTTVLNSNGLNLLPTISKTKVNISGSWYLGLNTIFSVGNTLSGLSILIVDRYNLETVISIDNPFVVRYTVENSIDTEIVYEAEFVGENNG